MVSRLLEENRYIAQIAVVCFVLIGFYTYPVSTIFFGKWPVQPSNIQQPAAGFAEFGWGSLITLFSYVILIVPFFGILFKVPVGAREPTQHVLVGRYWWHRACSLGFWLVGMGDHCSLYDCQCLADEALESHYSSPTLEGTYFRYTLAYYSLWFSPDL